MLQSALVIVALGGAVAQTYPDQLDILRGADTTPQIELVLDSSGSMEESSPLLNNNCDWFYNLPTNRSRALFNSNPAVPGNQMTRLDLLKAVLTGCQSATDGVLDVWANSVIFAVREFGTNANSGRGARTDLRANFFGGPVDAQGIPIGSNLPNLEAAVSGLIGEGATPLVRAYELAARHFGDDFDDTNSRHCRQNFIILMTDGVGNYSNSLNPTTWNFVAGQPTEVIQDSNGCFTGGPSCGNPTPQYADTAAAYLVRDALGNTVDALPNVSDTVLPSGGTRGQPIRTYTIGFSPPGDSQALLDAMAIAGEGQSYSATSYQQLSTAFTNIISSIVPRSQVAFSPGTIQNDGLFSGNYMYLPAFQPVENGYWYGNVKKHCVMPANTGDVTCLFRDDGTGNNTLATNPAVRDVFTGSTQRDATVGGTGQQMYSQLFGVTGPTATPPSNPYSYRNILTWRPGTTGYVPIGATSFNNLDSQTPNACEHYRLINKLHGFTDQVTDCAAGDYSPVGFDTWPQGDTANGGTAIIKFTDECESTASRCYVVTNSNDGMLHVFRGRDGVELSAVIPGDLWGTPQVANNRLRDIMDQPNLELLKRYYFDGGLRLFHEDSNANGYIDNTEVAYLIAGLGRGGYGYYLWDVSNFNGDFSSGTAPDPKPLVVDEATGFRNLRETWAAPWVGLFRDTSGNFHRVAMFASGHQRELDSINAGFAMQELGLPPTTTDSYTNPYSTTCTGLGLDATLCAPPFPTVGACTPCTTANPATAGCPAVTPPTTAYCYDWPGYSGVTAAAPFDQGQPTGHDLLFGPFTWSNGNQTADSYRVTFSAFDLQPNDYMEFLDSNQNVIGRLEANGVGSVAPCSATACSPWINSSSFYVRLVSDGNDSAAVSGWTVANIELIRRNAPPAARPAGSLPSITTNYTRPSVYMVNLTTWAGLPSFAARPTGANSSQGDAIMVRITSDCDGLQGPGEICIDATGSGGQPAQPDLAYMTCPISAEVSVYEEGNVFRTAYVGDECGQIWKLDQDSAGVWTTQRILRLNNADATGRTIANQRSEDYRKIFTRLELVLSRCNGSRSVGVYFGTGNIQRSGSQSVLSNPALVRVPGSGTTAPLPTQDGDVIGVVWDSPNLPRPPVGLGLADLENVTSAVQIANPTAGNAANGYFIELGFYGEKSLRNPVVLDGVATFKVYEPLQQATECVSAIGGDVVYQFDNCDAAPLIDTYDIGSVVGDTVADRITWFGRTDIGGGLLVFTPASGDAFVSTADINNSTSARLAARPNRRAMRLYLWRTNIQ